MTPPKNKKPASTVCLLVSVQTETHLDKGRDNSEDKLLGYEDLGFSTDFLVL